MLGAFYFMQVKFIAEIVADISVFPEDVCNFDTVGDYNTGLTCEVGNSALDYVSTHLKGFSDIKILSAEPIEEGIEQYSQMLNNWYPEYQEGMQEYESQRIQQNLG